MIQRVSGLTSKLHKVYIHPKCKMFTYVCAQVTSWLESVTVLNYSPNTINLVSLSTNRLIGTSAEDTFDH